MPSKSRNHAVAVALVLDLEHHALIRLVGSVGLFRDYAVEACSLEAPKPILCNVPVTCSRSEVDGGGRIPQQHFKFSSADFEWFTAQVTIAVAEQIEKHNRRRCLVRQELGPGGGRVQPELQGIKVELI